MPEFNCATRRGVFENAPAGTNVGKAVTAVDPSGDAVAYSLSGVGPDLFETDNSGQVTVAANTLLDHEATPSCTITVHAHDGRGGADSVTITTNVKNLDDKGTGGWAVYVGFHRFFQPMGLAVALVVTATRRAAWRPRLCWAHPERIWRGRGSLPASTSPQALSTDAAITAGLASRLRRCPSSTSSVR